MRIITDSPHQMDNYLTKYYSILHDSVTLLVFHLANCISSCIIKTTLQIQFDLEKDSIWLNSCSPFLDFIVMSLFSVYHDSSTLEKW